MGSQMSFHKIATPEPSQLAVFACMETHNYESAFVPHWKFWQQHIQNAEARHDIGGIILGDAVADLLEPHAKNETRANESKRPRLQRQQTCAAGLRTLALSLFIRSELEHDQTQLIGLEEIAAGEWPSHDGLAIPLRMPTSAADSFFGFSLNAPIQWCQRGQLIVERSQISVEEHVQADTSTEVAAAYLAVRN